MELHIVDHYYYYMFPHHSDWTDPPRGWLPANDLVNSDAVFLTKCINGSTMERELQSPGLRLLPVISLYGSGEPWYDHVCGNPHDPSKMTEVFDITTQIITRTRDVPKAIRESQNLEDYILAHLYTRNKHLLASYAPGRKEAVSYPIALPTNIVIEAATRLVDAALMNRRFFDRLHVCPDCNSSRLNVREECIACRSSHVAEEHIVHHYKCGHEARESAFRTPSHFQCPKCGEALRHIGLDYDKPGIVIACNSCGHMTDASAVGFVCMDCGTRSDSDRTGVRDWYNYELTALGTQKLLHNDVRIQVHSLPIGFATLLRQALLEEAEFKTAFVVVRLAFSKQSALQKESPAVWARLKNLTYDCIRSGIRAVDVACEFGNEFLVLFPRCGVDMAMERVADIRTRLREVLKHDTGLVAHQVPRDEQLLYLNDIENSQKRSAAYR